ncbi:MAG: hypothetical protein Q7R35_00810, partial [Elusimicrobiota bacterium]|nr:hypothetical protein [Elusimicrobiota bacterium]
AGISRVITALLAGLGAVRCAGVLTVDISSLCSHGLIDVIAVPVARLPARGIAFVSTSPASFPFTGVYAVRVAPLPSFPLAYCGPIP